MSKPSRRQNRQARSRTAGISKEAHSVKLSPKSIDRLDVY